MVALVSALMALGPINDCRAADTGARRKVIIEADGDVPHGEVVKVAGAIAQIEGITVHVGVQEPKGN